MSLELDPQHVKRGIWTNVDGGPILGKTITTDTQTGNLVVALLAVLSTLGTAHLWHLVAFAIHQIRANGRPMDALFRQQQAMLRTLPTPSSVVAEAVKLWWAWRKRADRPFLRSALLVLIAILFTAMTIAASIFSSLIVKTGTIDVLVDSSRCAAVRLNGTAWRTYSDALTQTAPAYTQTCYQDGALSASCNVFTRPNILPKASNVTCPFNETMCDTEDSIRVDSGLIDVGKAFGLNLAAENGVSMRKKTECTILPIEGYYEVYYLEDFPFFKPEIRDIIAGEQIVPVFYGPRSDLISPESFLGYLVASNVSGNPRVARGGAFYNNSEGLVKPTWFPNEEFFPLRGPESNGDLYWKPFMSNALLFKGPVNDPLYSAHKAVATVDASTGESIPNYLADYPVKGVGCRQHYQFCHARSGKDDFCTPLSGLYSYALEEKDFEEANSMQRALIQLLINSSWLYQSVNVVSCKVTTLMSKNDFNMEPLPDDFWKQEVIGWEYETWAAMQIAVSNYAIGPQSIDPYEDGYLLKPETQGEKALCGVQKMKKTGGFVNINVFGLSFIAAFSILVAIIDITLLKFLIYLSRFRRALGPRIARWTQDGVWQLQRRAYEGEGHREWTDLESEIPLMEKGHKLKDLSILWLPGKSPMMVQTTSFTSSNSSVSEQPPMYDGSVNSAEAIEENAGQRTGWYEFWRRR